MASLSTWTGRPTASTRRARRGKSRHPGMLSGDTDSPPRVIGPAGPHAAGDLVAGANLRNGGEQGCEHRLAVATVRRGAHAPGDQVASSGDDPGRHLRAADVESEHTVHGAEPIHWPRRQTDGSPAYPVPAALRRGAHRWPPVRPPFETPSPTTTGRCSRTSSGSSRASPRSSSSSSCAWSPRATSSSRTCRASARPAWPRRWPRRSTGTLRPVAVHPGPAAHRRRGPHGVEPQHQRVRVPARSGVRQHRAGRRDQPGLTEDAVGAARVDGRDAGHGRRHDLPARQPVHGDRHPEPDRARGHLPAAREAARSVPHADLGRLPVHRERARDPRDPRRPRRLRGHRLGDHQPRRAGHDRRRQGGARGARPQGIPRRPGQRLAPSPAPRARHVAARHPRPPEGRSGPSRRQRAQLRRYPTTSRRWPSRCWPTGSSSPPRRSSRASARRTPSTEVLRAVPVPAGKAR